MVASGCTSLPIDSDVSVPTVSGPFLSDLSACSFSYPDGTPTDCAQRAADAGPLLRQPPAGWVCWVTSGGGARNFGLYREPASGQYGLRFAAAGISSDARGLITVTTGSDVRMYNMHAESPSGFVALGDLPQSGHLTVLIYATSITSTTAELAGATIEQHWSVYEDKPWPVHAIFHHGRSAFIQHVVYVPGAANEMLPVVLTGSDFDLTISYAKGLRGEADYGPLSDGCMS